MVLCNAQDPRRPMRRKARGRMGVLAPGAKTRMQREGDADVTLVFFNNPDAMQRA